MMLMKLKWKQQEIDIQNRIFLLACYCHFFFIVSNVLPFIFKVVFHGGSQYSIITLNWLQNFICICLFPFGEKVHNFHQVLREVHDLKKIKNHYSRASFKTFQDNMVKSTTFVFNMCISPLPSFFFKSTIFLWSLLNFLLKNVFFSVASVLLQYEECATNSLKG